MRFLYQPIIPPRMVAMGFLSRRSESLVLCGRTEAVDAITIVFGEKSGRFDAAVSRFRKNWRGGVLLAFTRSPTPIGYPAIGRAAAVTPRFCKANVTEAECRY